VKFRLDVEFDPACTKITFATAVLDSGVELAMGMSTENVAEALNNALASAYRHGDPAARARAVAVLAAFRKVTGITESPTS
jgi:hypothetical protein